MKVLLISPPAKESFLDNFFRHIAGQTGITMALPFLAAYLRQRNIDVEVLDVNYLGYNNKKVLRKINKIKPDFLGVSALFPQLSVVDDLLKDLPDEIKTIVGGSFSVTPADKYVMERYEHIKVVCRGEGQQTLYEFIKGKSLKKIKGISYKSNGSIKQNPERELIENVDKLPFPAWDLLPNTGKVGYAITSFGCTFPCTFCTTSKLFQKKIRYHSADYVIKNLIWLNKDLHKKHIIFLDDNFILNYQRTMKIFEGIKENGLNFQWDANARADLINRWGEEFVSKAYDAGCRLFLIGVESGDPRILKKYNKAEKMKEFKKAFDLCHKIGIETIAGILIGPYETRKSIMKTFDILKEIKSDIVIPQILTPEMGTEIFDVLNKEGRITSFDFDLYDHLHFVYEPYNMSLTELKFWHYLMALWSNLRIRSLMKDPKRYTKIVSFALKELTKKYS